MQMVHTRKYDMTTETLLLLVNSMNKSLEGNAIRGTVCLTVSICVEICWYMSADVIYKLCLGRSRMVVCLVYRAPGKSTLLPRFTKYLHGER